MVDDRLSCRGDAVHVESSGSDLMAFPAVCLSSFTPKR